MTALPTSATKYDTDLYLTEAYYEDTMTTNFKDVLTEDNPRLVADMLHARAWC